MSFFHIRDKDKENDIMIDGKYDLTNAGKENES